MSTEVNCGQVRGPVQISFSRSFDPIISSEHAITRSSVTKKADKEKERTMGRKFTVPYGLYRAYGFINPFLAEQRGFDEKDLDLFWESLINAFQFDQSAARPAGSMAPRNLVVFKHDKPLGNAPSHKLFELVTINRRSQSKPPRDFSDYEVKIDRESLPQGVSLIEML
jgi:CRISPR-associated protein Csd2